MVACESIVHTRPCCSIPIFIRPNSLADERCSVVSLYWNISKLFIHESLGWKFILFFVSSFGGGQLLWFNDHDSLWWCKFCRSWSIFIHGVCIIYCANHDEFVELIKWKWFLSSINESSIQQLLFNSFSWKRNFLVIKCCFDVKKKHNAHILCIYSPLCI